MDMINSLIIDRALRGTMISKSTSEVLFTVNQITDPSLSCTSENQTVADALGATVAILDRSKAAELSANNALFDTSLIAANMGATRKISSANNTFIATCFDEITITAAQKTDGSVTLAHTPNDVGSPTVAGSGLSYIYKLNSDGTMATKYSFSDTPGADSFEYTGTTLTFPTALAAGDVIWAVYDYVANDSDVAMLIDNQSDVFSPSGKFVLEVLFRDICDSAKKIYGYIIFNSAKLDGNFDWSIAPDASLPFKVIAQADYCGASGKSLCKICIPEPPTAA